MKKRTQTEMVLDYMRENGGITTWEAIQEFGCTRISAKIYNLKRQGWNIDSEPVTRKNRYGHPVKFSRYFIVKEGKG